MAFHFKNFTILVNIAYPNLTFRYFIPYFHLALPFKTIEKVYFPLLLQSFLKFHQISLFLSPRGGRGGGAVGQNIYRWMSMTIFIRIR